MAYSVTFSQRLVESIYAYGAEEFQANAYDRHRAIDVLVNKGTGFKDTQAGTFVIVPVNVKRLGITQLVSEGSEYALTNTEGDQAAQYKWYTAVTPLVFTDEELGENQGKQQIINTVKNKISEAKLDHTTKLNDQLILGTGGANSDTESFATIIGTADNGGLSVSTYPKWVSYTANGGNISATMLDAAIDATMFGSDQGIDCIFSNLTLFQRWKDLSQAKTTIFQPSDSTKSDVGYAGHEVIQFRGALN